MAGWEYRHIASAYPILSDLLVSRGRVGVQILIPLACVLLFVFLKALLCLFQYREERFRQTSESTNQRVLWWSIVQTLILVAIGFWQMRHLKSFFEAKKLV